MRSDVIIIGSGFGGSFAAHRLVNAGAKVTMIERGPWRQTAALERLGVQMKRSPLPRGRHVFSHLVREVHAPFLKASGVRLNRHGLFDIHLGGELTVVCSSGVGGGSHVYSAMNTRPIDPAYWTGHVDGVDEHVMSPWYDEALKVMGSQVPQPGEGMPNFTGDRLAADPLLKADPDLAQPAMGYRFESGHYRNNSFFGSAQGDKVTLDERLIVPATAQGLTVLDRHEALDIGAAAKGCRVTVRDEAGRYRHLQAPRLIIAAGTLNTLRLMLSSRARGQLGELPGLGLGLGGNGDSPAWWACQHEDADYSLGPPCHGRFALREGDTPGYLTSFGLNGVDELPLPASTKKRLKQSLLLVGMGADGANGQAVWRKGRLQLRYDREANPILGDIAKAYRQLGLASGRPLYQFPQWPATVHPLGGARLSQSARTGVVNGQGQVHGLPGLYVADASALPAAPGTPPSMTIAAWGQHVAQGICLEG